eukprot:7042529-Prymnesium_polylepis.1
MLDSAQRGPRRGSWPQVSQVLLRNWLVSSISLEGEMVHARTTHGTWSRVRVAVGSVAFYPRVPEK